MKSSNAAAAAAQRQAKDLVSGRVQCPRIGRPVGVSEAPPEREEARGELAQLAEDHKGAERHGEDRAHGRTERGEPHQRRAGATPPVGRGEHKAGRGSEGERACRRDAS